MTGYRAFSRDFVKTFPILSQGFEIETEMTIHAVDKNFLIREIPVEYRDRPEGSVSKLNTYADGMKVLGTIFKLYKDYKPMAFFGIFALVFLLASVGFFIPVLVDYIRTGPGAPLSDHDRVGHLGAFCPAFLLDRRGAGRYREKASAVV